MATKFVILDPPRGNDDRPGYAVKDPLEGWFFTVLLSSATRFDTESEAENAIKNHYQGKRGERLIVTPVSK